MALSLLVRKQSLSGHLGPTAVTLLTHSRPARVLGHNATESNVVSLTQAALTFLCNRCAPDPLGVQTHAPPIDALHGERRLVGRFG